MAYVGRGTDNISNVEVLDNITFDGSSTYTLQKGSVNFVPTSANNILVSIDGVVQANNFSVSTSTIDFGVAIAGTSTCNFILHFGTGLVTTVQDGAITSAKLGADSVTYAKLQNLATANRVLGSASTGLIGETQIATAMVSDDAITYGKMQDTVGANKVLGAVTAGTIGEVTIATDMLTDASVDEAKLKISNVPTNGQFLSAQSGDTGGLTWASAGGGKIGQVITAIDSTQRTTSATSWATGSSTLTLDITPATTGSKIFVIVNTTIGNSSSAIMTYGTIFRDSTNTGSATKGLGGHYTNGGNRINQSYMVLDSPNTSSQITYTFQVQVASGTAQFMYDSTQGSITAWEVLA